MPNTFWSDDNNKLLLRDILSCLCKEKPTFSAGKIEHLFIYSNYKAFKKNPKLPGADIPEYGGVFISGQVINRFISKASIENGENQINSTAKCDGLLVAAHHIASTSEEQKGKMVLHEKIAQLQNRLNSLKAEQVRISRVVGADDGIFPGIAVSHPKHPLTNLRNLFSTHVNDTDFKCFFRESDRNNIATFYTYRYARKAGYIVKTELFIIKPYSKPPVATMPYYNFINNYKDENSSRRTYGLVLNMKDGFYFVGSTDMAHGLKILVIRHIAGDARRFTGLVLSSSSDGDLLSGRVLMLPGNNIKIDPKREGLPVGIYKEADMLAELGSQNIDDLRNQIPFTLDKKIFYKGKQIEALEMVGKVSNLLREGQVYRGKPLFSYENGDEFNPAKTKEYTFNAALRFTGK